MKDPNAIDLDDIVEKGLSTTGIKQLLDWVAQYSWWVPRQVYEKVSVVYPKTRRKHAKESRGSVDGAGNRLWFNEPAIEAFWRACGKSPRQLKNYYVCHIYDDSVHDPNHFTNLANLTGFPKSLQSLSEWGPVAAVLKYHSFKMYGYKGPREIQPPEPDYYPVHWHNQLELPPETTKRVVMRLEEQRTNRSQFHAAQGIELPRTSEPQPYVSNDSLTEVVRANKTGFKSRSYLKGQSCKMLGFEHEYELVAGKNYEKCYKCNSTRTIKL